MGSSFSCTNVNTSKVYPTEEQIIKNEFEKHNINFANNGDFKEKSYSLRTNDVNNNRNNDKNDKTAIITSERFSARTNLTYPSSPTENTKVPYSRECINTSDMNFHIPEKPKQSFESYSIDRKMSNRIDDPVPTQTPSSSQATCFKKDDNEEYESDCKCNGDDEHDSNNNRNENAYFEAAEDEDDDEEHRLNMLLRSTMSRSMSHSSYHDDLDQQSRMLLDSMDEQTSAMMDITAMSLDMDKEELLMNMLYFSNQENNGSNGHSDFIKNLNHERESGYEDEINYEENKEYHRFNENDIMCINDDHDDDNDQIDYRNDAVHNELLTALNDIENKGYHPCCKINNTIDDDLNADNCDRNDNEEYEVENHTNNTSMQIHHASSNSLQNTTSSSSARNHLHHTRSQLPNGQHPYSFQAVPVTLTLGQLINGAMAETFALHSQNNTPYKLRPLNTDIREQLLKPIAMHELKAHNQTTQSANSSSSRLTTNLNKDSAVAEEHLCCLICREDIKTNETVDQEVEEEMVIKLSNCGHLFHSECLLKWVTLQDWCPVCRAKIDPETS